MFAAVSTTVGSAGFGALKRTIESVEHGTNRPPVFASLLARGTGGIAPVVGVVEHDARIVDDAIASGRSPIRHIDVILEPFIFVLQFADFIVGARFRRTLRGVSEEP
jgi:hypothetical protein